MQLKVIRLRGCSLQRHDVGVSALQGGTTRRRTQTRVTARMSSNQVYQSNALRSSTQNRRAQVLTARAAEPRHREYRSFVRIVSESIGRVLTTCHSLAASKLISQRQKHSPKLSVIFRYGIMVLGWVGTNSAVFAGTNQWHAGLVTAHLNMLLHSPQDPGR